MWDGRFSANDLGYSLPVGAVLDDFHDDVEATA